LLVRIASALFHQKLWNCGGNRGRLGFRHWIRLLAAAPTCPAQARSRSASHAGRFLAPQRALWRQIALVLIVPTSQWPVVLIGLPPAKKEARQSRSSQLHSVG